MPRKLISSQVLGGFFFYLHSFTLPNQVCRVVLFAHIVSLSIFHLPHRVRRTVEKVFILRPEPDDGEYRG